LQVRIKITFNVGTEMERWLNNVCARFMLCAFVLIFSLHTVGAPAKADSATFYVATDGDDSNPGAKAKPFATIARARDAVRQIKVGAAGPIKVLIRRGTYYQSEPLVFGPQESGTDAPSISADPLFVDLENGDFRLKPNSPMFKLGFKPIDTTKIGLRDDFPRRYR